MVYKTIQARVTDAFVAEHNADAAFGEKYLELLYANWALIASSLRRTATLLVILMVGFIALAHAKNTEFTLGPLKLTNIASVLILVPAIVSFLAYEFLLLGIADSYYADVSDAVMRVVHRSVSQNSLELMLRPPTASLWGDDGWLSLRSSEPGVAHKLIDWTGNMVLAFLVFGTVIFLIYAYMALYENAHANTVAVTVSAVFAGFNAVRAFLVVFDTSDTA